LKQMRAIVRHSTIGRRTLYSLYRLKNRSVVWQRSSLGALRPVHLLGRLPVPSARSAF
jgi:hypothetical protein